MTVFQALVLGLVQGLSEFLPISSSAHLTLTPWFFGWQDPGLAFDVALHIGTLVAVAWYFRRDWAALIASAWHVVRTRRVESPDEWRVVYLAIATVPAAIAGLVLNDLAKTTFRSPRLIATTLVLMGVALWLADRGARQDRALPAMRWRDALLIGLGQALALVPGVSRSGATITGARLLRFDRQSAAVFSFLMSFPVTAAAAVLEAPEAIRAADAMTPLVVGVVAAAVSSWLAIEVLLRFLVRHSFGVFAAYRLALGGAVFLVLAVRG